MKTSSVVSALAVLTAATAAQGSIQDERGIKPISDLDRLTLHPYVSFSYTYDSNVDSSKHSTSGSQWTVNPGLSLDYQGETWAFDASVWYQYHAYNRYTSQLNQSSYGEQTQLEWTSAGKGEPGWDIQFSQRFQQIAQDDDMSNSNGRGTGRDRKEFEYSLDLGRRVNEHWHASLVSDYYLLDYDNNVNKYATLYGWKRLTVGGMLGYTASKWSDILVRANYKWYWQDNDYDGGKSTHAGETARNRHVSGDSKGWSVMAGLGTHMTEKLEYRLLVGWTHFEYGSGTHDADGCTYEVSGNWQVDAENTWSISLLGSSDYQPSEREYGSAIKVYTVSVGIHKELVRRQLHGTIDLAYRKEAHEYTSYGSDDYDEDIWTGRIGLSYDVNRILTVFGRIEYQSEYASGGGVGHTYDYDRWRGTVGFSLNY